MKINKYTFWYSDATIAHELKMPYRKFQMILERYNITKRGKVMYEFKLRGLMSNEQWDTEEPDKFENVLAFSEKGKRWIKKLVLLLDSDITTSDWVE